MLPTLYGWAALQAAGGAQRGVGDLIGRISPEVPGLGNYTVSSGSQGFDFCQEYRIYIDKPAICLVDELPEPASEMAQRQIPGYEQDQPDIRR